MNKVKVLALSGAAVLFLAGAANAGQSTAKERAETAALNMAQAQATQQQVPVTDASNATANAAPAAAPTMPVRTADASPIINSKPADPIGPVTVTPMQVALIGAAPAAASPALAPMALNSMSNPPDKLATARVVDEQGTAIGAVQKVNLQGGKPSDVQIALLGTQQVVSLGADKLSYDASSNVLTAALDKSQIVRLPAEPLG